MNLIEMDVELATQADDIKLVERYLQGDMAAFEAFYERHNTKLYNLIRCHLGDHYHAAEDVAQIVWSEWLQYCLKGEKRAEDLGPKLLSTMGRSRAFDYLRPLRKMQSLTVEVDGETLEFDCVDDAALESEARNDLIASVNQVLYQQVDVLQQQIAQADTPFARASAEKQLAKVAVITDQQRQLFELSWMNYTLEEIAEQLNLTVNQVRSRQKMLFELLKSSDICR